MEGGTKSVGFPTVNLGNVLGKARGDKLAGANFCGACAYAGMLFKRATRESWLAARR